MEISHGEQFLFMMEETDNQHRQLFLVKGQTVVSSAERNGRKSMF